MNNWIEDQGRGKLKSLDIDDYCRGDVAATMAD